MIDNFKDDYAFLSNFYPSIIVYNTIEYPTVEHFFQAMKTMDERVRVFIASLQFPGQAKKAGRQVDLRCDWEDIKLKVMAFGVLQKFKIPHLRAKLIETYPHHLIEGNWWHDNIWGDCRCAKCSSTPGKNYLGQLLEKVRMSAINEQKELGPDPSF